MIYKLNLTKYILREILLRPLNLILLPVLGFLIITSNLLASEEDVRSKYWKKLDKKILWWDLKSGCIYKVKK